MEICNILGGYRTGGCAFRNDFSENPAAKKFYQFDEFRITIRLQNNNNNNSNKNDDDDDNNNKRGRWDNQSSSQPIATDSAQT